MIGFLAGCAFALMFVAWLLARVENRVLRLYVRALEEAVLRDEQATRDAFLASLDEVEEPTIVDLFHPN